MKLYLLTILSCLWSSIKSNFTDDRPNYRSIDERSGLNLTDKHK